MLCRAIFCISSLYTIRIVQTRPENMKLEIFVWIIQFASRVSTLPDSIRIGKRRAYDIIYYIIFFMGAPPDNKW